MGRDHIWRVEQHLWDYCQVLAGQRANEMISEADYVEKLRSIGFPADAQPGDNICIQLIRSTSVLVNRHGKRVLPGLPN